jgi:hypothetical protein
MSVIFTALLALCTLAGIQFPGNNNLDGDKKEEKHSPQRCDIQ